MPMSSPCTIDRCDSCSAKVVCRCLQVTEEQLVRMITALDLRTVRDLRKQTGVGDGCTCCHRELEGYLERFSLAVVA
jgi:bacterioferritin-associated ferredoxin